MRWEAHRRLKALFTIAASRDVVERVKSHVHSVVIDLGRGTFGALSQLSPFFFSSCFVKDLIAEDKTRHQEKWVKAVVGMVTKIWKEGLLLACFWAWPKVWVDGWLFLARFGSNSVFPVIDCLVCDTDSPRGTAGEGLSSFPYVLSHSTFCSLNVYSRRATWGGEAEPGGFNGLCRRSKEDRGKATQRRRSRQLRRAHEGPPWYVQAYVQQGLGKEPVQRY